MVRRMKPSKMFKVFLGIWHELMCWRGYLITLLVVFI